MLVGSLVVHGGLIGIGALFVQPPPSHVDLDFDPEPEGAYPTPISVTEPPPESAADLTSIATPDPAVKSDATPPSVNPEETFAEPSPPTSHRQTAAQIVVPVRASSVRPTSVTTGVGPVSVPGSNPGVGAAAWVMPHPPYPVTFHNSSVRGTTTVRITTDAMGAVSNVVVVQSAGNLALDAHTVRYVRENWHGPANASRTTQFVYQVR